RHCEVKIVPNDLPAAHFRKPKEAGRETRLAPSAIWRGQYPITDRYVNLNWLARHLEGLPSARNGRGNHASAKANTTAMINELLILIPPPDEKSKIASEERSELLVT